MYTNAIAPICLASAAAAHCRRRHDCLHVLEYGLGRRQSVGGMALYRASKAALNSLTRGAHHAPWLGKDRHGLTIRMNLKQMRCARCENTHGPQQARLKIDIGGGEAVTVDHQPPHD